MSNPRADLAIKILGRAKQLFDLQKVVMYGYDIDENSVTISKEKIKDLYPEVELHIEQKDFLTINFHDDLFTPQVQFDFIIANPPYIRTQSIEESKVKYIASKFKLTGRFDMYYAFFIAALSVLKPDGIAGFITSNKFLTINSGKILREFLYSHSTILNITDFGDTKVFGAAVLPCVTIFKKGTNAAKYQINFNSIYLQQDQPESPVAKCKSIYECIKKDGYFIDNNQIMYRSRSGYYTIDQKKCSDPWVIGDKEQDRWLEKVNQNTWKTFDEIGKVRVGIKTTADNIFLFNKDAKSVDIELIKELITHRNAGCYLANNKISWSVLYPHKSINGKKTVIDIDLYPKTKSYLLEHFDQLNNRNYIKKAKRKWYEIWVPQNPALWSHRKIVFRDITEFPQFWYVSEDAVVNGDCYWIDFNNTVSEEIIYLMLAVANSQFIVNFYDRKFNTKLYSSKRRFMTQYVEKFPLPDPTKKESLKIISIVKEILNSQNLDKTQKAEIDSLVEKSFS